MPVLTTYPGVYIEELSSGVHTITGVATSIAAFVGYTPRGLDSRAVQIFSFADFQREFGGLAADSELSFAVHQFYQNGGATAYVVRVKRDGATAALVGLLDANGGQPSLVVEMLSSGTWSNEAIIDVDYDGVSDPTNDFNLTISDLSTGTIETFDDLTIDNTKNNFVSAIVNDPDNGSQLVSVVVATGAASRPAATGLSGGDITLSDIKNDQIYTIKIILDSPATNAEFPFITPSDTLPGSIASVCRMLQSRATAALAATLPGVSVQCMPTLSGKGLRVVATVPNAYDAQVTFDAGTTADANAFLKLSAGNATSNVSHYWPASPNGGAWAESSPEAGSDGTGLPTADELVAGISALDKVDLFNILCLPDVTRALPGNPNQPALGSTDQNLAWSAAMTYCDSRRAFLLIDPPPDVSDVGGAMDWKTAGLTVNDKNGAAYFPRLKLPDQTNNSQLRTFAPCGVVAGLYARTDAARGVWKAPAGTEATLAGVQGLTYKLTDAENGALNPLGLNCFRIFPIYGAISWGARTLVGADEEASEWKYIPVRRFALFLEESLYRGTQWVVFEPNDDTLWAQIRLNVGSFMQGLFRQGAFQGNTPSQAYLVKCDSETTTQDDINRGVVNILVGFAPLQPAEFVIIQIQQLAGQAVT